MRRPFDWLVICLSLLVLWANRVWLVDAPSDRSTASVSPAKVRLSGQEPPAASPFAYIQEDGTQVYLPVTESAAMRTRVAHKFEPMRVGTDHAAPAPARAPAGAVYTWSTVIGTVMPESPASR